ncbi:ion transporter [Teredinibacter turnerae]|uniref:ion transporter n=1 Tax=Teredinibacter turnerae TaxID=2426 RepID=UPI0005F76BAB|nr:ion transporter [Teredinibacter turnerae]
MKDVGSPLYKVVLLFLSVYVLSALIAEAFLFENAETRRVLQYIDFGVCLLFLIDFFVGLWKAPQKLSYMKWGWIDLISSIPAVDPLRWGRLSKMVRIVRYLRAIKSLRILLSHLRASKFETLSLCVFLLVFITYSISAAMILEFERATGSTISTAEKALWWAFLNLLNAKTSISEARSTEGVLMTILLNKMGILLFAYLNSMIVAWLVVQRKKT